MPRGRRSQLLACAVGGLVLSCAAIEKSSLPRAHGRVADTVWVYPYSCKVVSAHCARRRAATKLGAGRRPTRVVSTRAVVKPTRARAVASAATMTDCTCPGCGRLAPATGRSVTSNRSRGASRKASPSQRYTRAASSRVTTATPLERVPESAATRYPVTGMGDCQVIKRRSASPR